jgi:hypothetical protein
MTTVPLRYTGNEYAAVFRTPSDEFWDYYAKVYATPRDMLRDISERQQLAARYAVSDFCTPDALIAAFEQVNALFVFELLRAVDVLKKTGRILPKTALTLDDILTAAPTEPPATG